MTSVRFWVKNNDPYGFEMNGHSTSDCDDTEGKFVCASISSAAYMAANTVTDVIGDKAEVEVQDGYMRLTVNNPSQKTVAVLSGLKLHLEALASDFKGKIRIITEV